MRKQNWDWWKTEKKTHIKRKKKPEKTKEWKEIEKPGHMVKTIQKTEAKHDRMCTESAKE
jgi:hypothetical protein